ncbi:hypothetical protein [uncultured Friedmanniella sp.]|uniref:hypothetical protein n=1 Tax=uncultured Friedmanniella sp. TaxID=335381 RepID=UPI0035CB7C92
MTRYTVRAERSGKWWALQCEEEPGALSQVSRLDQAEEHMREAIAFVAEVLEESVEVDVIPVISESTRRHMTAAAEARTEYEEAQKRAARESRAAARELAKAGLSMRDIGKVMGVSFQRAQQLVKGCGRSTD